MQRHDLSSLWVFYSLSMLIDYVKLSEKEESLREFKLLEDAESDHVLWVLGELPQFLETRPIYFDILNEFRCNCNPYIRVFAYPFITFAIADKMSLGIRG